MAAYVISEVEILDPVAVEEYKRLAAASIEQYGGHYIVRGGSAEVVEGGPAAKSLIIVEFPSMDRLREWYASAEYAAALTIRHAALDRRLIFVEGV